MGVRAPALGLSEGKFLRVALTVWCWTDSGEAQARWGREGLGVLSGRRWPFLFLERNGQCWNTWERSGQVVVKEGFTSQLTVSWV